MPVYSVIVIGEIRLFREGLMQLIAADGRLDICAGAESVSEGVALLQRRECSAVLLDMATRASIDGIRQLHGVRPAVKVVALGVADLEADIVECAQAGVDGYVPRIATLDELVRSVECAMAGGVHCSPKAASHLFRRLAEMAPIIPALESSSQQLTRREQEVLELIQSGLSNKQIARTLGIELCTVKNHVHHVLEKLNVQRRSQINARYSPRGASRSTANPAQPVPA